MYADCIMPVHHPLDDDSFMMQYWFMLTPSSLAFMYMLL